MNLIELKTQLEADFNIKRQINIADTLHKIDNLISVFNKYVPFKVGDIVCLNKDVNPTIEDSPGWFRYRSMLIKGNFGKVVDTDFFNNEFKIIVTFEQEQCSYINTVTGVCCKTKEQTFCFSENYLEFKKD